MCATESRNRPPSRRTLLAASAALAAALCMGWAQAETPAVKILVGFSPGGGTDAIARLLAEPLAEQLGQPVVVENRAGAGGQIAAQALKAAAADGHTLLLSHDHTISILPQVVKDPGFDPARDFVPVAGFATFVNGLAVAGGTAVTDFSSYLESVRRSGGKSAVGIPAPASVPGFLVQALGRSQQLDLVAVPYRGSAPLVADLMGGQIPAGVASVPDFIAAQRAGRIRVLAVMGKSRQAVLPQVPTFAELGLTGFEEEPYYGLFAPAGTPRAMLERLGNGLARVIAQPAVRESLTGMGLAVDYMTPEQLGRREAAYARTWARIIRDSGFQPQ